MRKRLSQIRYDLENLTSPTSITITLYNEHEKLRKIFGVDDNAGESYYFPAISNKRITISEIFPMLWMNIRCLFNFLMYIIPKTGYIC